VYFIIDLLHLDGDDVGARPLIERKARLAALLSGVTPPLHYSAYHRGRGSAFHEQACRLLQLEGIVSKRADAPYAPGARGPWLKVKYLHREEFVIVGWTDPEGRRPYLGALLLAYYDPEGRLVYAGRAGTGIRQAELERLSRRPQPLATEQSHPVLPSSSRRGEPARISGRRPAAPTGPWPWHRPSSATACSRRRRARRKRAALRDPCGSRGNDRS
jgi:bifunctional non-homologous end joining protein LigD